MKIKIINMSENIADKTYVNVVSKILLSGFVEVKN